MTARWSGLTILAAGVRDGNSLDEDQRGNVGSPSLDR